MTGPAGLPGPATLALVDAARDVIDEAAGNAAAAGPKDGGMMAPGRPRAPQAARYRRQPVDDRHRPRGGVNRKPGAAVLISPDSRRVECEPTDPHFHVWKDCGLVVIAQPPRFNTRQTARKAAIRSGLEPGAFEVKRCALPCRFTVKRTRKRKRRKCRHCGRTP